MVASAAAALGTAGEMRGRRNGWLGGFAKVDNRFGYDKWLPGGTLHCRLLREKKLKGLGFRVSGGRIASALLYLGGRKYKRMPQLAARVGGFTRGKRCLGRLGFRV